MAKKNKDEQIHLRVTKDEKAVIEYHAKKHGYKSLSAYILDLDSKKGIRNYDLEKKLWDSLQTLSKEFSYIGKNINQVVHEIHLIKKDIMPNTNQGDRLNELLKSYNDRREKLIETIQKFTENGI